MQRPLILNGFMATGKSTLGRLAAQRAGLDFVDLDEMIEQQAGATVAEIFARHGEAHFRGLEQTLLLQLLDDSTPRVIAVGGGALLARAARLAALERAVVVSLTADPDTLKRRAHGDSTQRPLLAGGGQQLELLMELRAPAYAEAHARLDVTNHTPQELVESVLDIWRRDPVAVAAGHNSYSVEIGRGQLRARLTDLLGGASSALLITDDNVDALYGQQVRAAMQAAGHEAHCFRLTPGEEHKNRDSLGLIWDHCLATGQDRKSRFIGLGGGVATDVAGFAAATWMRGVSWISAPTTLLGMVDASVGGKTAVDLPGAKNVIGAFWQPSAVVCDVELLQSEPRRGYISALAEVVKTALIGDAAMFELLEREHARVAGQDWDLVTDLVRRCIAVKASVVSRDEREGGLRASLNLGHTIGHAIEAQAGYGTLTHGEAVSLGLVAAVEVGVTLGKTPRSLADRVVRLLRALELPTDLSSQSLDEAAKLLANDKKRGGKDVRFVLTTEPGSIVFHKLALPELERLTCSLA